MKDEPWRGDPALRCQHLEKKISNQKARIRELEQRGTFRSGVEAALAWIRENQDYANSAGYACDECEAALLDREEAK